MTTDVTSPRLEVNESFRPGVGDELINCCEHVVDDVFMLSNGALKELSAAVLLIPVL